MRLLIGAAMAAALMAAPAVAQTNAVAPAAAPPTCGALAPAPTLPDGATASRAQITQGNETYQSWGSARLAQLTTCRAQIDALRAQLNGLEASYNSGNEELRRVTEAWQADVEEFNARGGASSGRQRGGVLTRPDH
ncbi:MAG: hypothetical protein JNM59_11430 [Hyphomonadaceae bacterium]|nr:hypothetical protein [Hyphomonadaceae bacterium]